MADSEKLTALKKAYADIILNTAKEAAARIMLSERKAQRYQRELFSAKDEALRMLLRLKKMLDSKVNEAEMASLSQRRRIEELEAQLGEAEDIVKDLRTELRELQDELEKVTNSQMQPLDEKNSEGQNDTQVAALEDKRLSTSGSVVSSLPTLKCHPVITHEVNNSTLNGTCDGSKCCSENDCNEHNCFVCHPDFASMVMRSKEPELYRNGCTQRIRAFERNLLGGSLSLSGQADGKNLIFIREEKEDEDICKQLGVKVDNICDTEKSPDLFEDTEAGNRSRKRRRSLNLVVNNGGIPGTPRRKRAARYRRYREYESFPHQTVDNIFQTGEDSGTIDRSQKDPEHSLSDKNEMMTKSGYVEVTKSEADVDRNCELQNSTDNNKLSIGELEVTRQDAGTAESSEFPASKIDFDTVNEMLANSNPKKPDATEVVPTRPMNNKFIKYTFQRKKKKESPNSTDGNSSLYCNTMKRRMGEKQSGFMESQKSGFIAESSRGNRRMAQVARQLISLSEKKWR